VPVRALGKCGGYTSDIADGIIWASGGTVSGVPNVAARAQVINMSLGGSGACDTTTQNASSDYDLYVYNSAGTLLARSENGPGAVDSASSSNTGSTTAARCARRVLRRRYRGDQRQVHAQADLVTCRGMCVGWTACRPRVQRSCERIIRSLTRWLNAWTAKLPTLRCICGNYR